MKPRVFVTRRVADRALDAIAALCERDASRLIGVLANCQGLRYRRPRDLAITVECPLARPDGQDVAALTALMDASQSQGTFVVLETSPYLPTSAPGTRLMTIETPPGRAPLALYDLAPASASTSVSAP